MNDDEKTPANTQSPPENEQLSPDQSVEQPPTDSEPQQQPATENPPAAQSPDSTPQPQQESTPPPPKSTSSKRWVPIVIAIVVSLALIGAAVAAWSGSQNTASTNQTQQDTTAVDQDQTQQRERAVAYTQRLEVADTQLGIGQRPESVPVAGGEMSSSDSTIEGIINLKATKGQKVLFATSGVGVNESLWFSDDSGQTYRRLFEAAPPASANSIGGQITSLVFSGDGSSALFAYLVEEDGDTANTVKEVTFTDGSIVDIFTEEKDAGVFLYGYDTANSAIYYETGCYNCGGSAGAAILRYDTGLKTISEVYRSNAAVGSAKIPNPDMTKMLMRTASAPAEELGTEPPYELLEIDLASGQAVSLLKSEDESITAFGYSAEGEVYYAKGNAVYLAENNRLLFESGQPIGQVYFVDSNTVVATAGTVAAGYKLYSILFAENKITELLGGVDDTVTVIGVVE